MQVSLKSSGIFFSVSFVIPNIVVAFKLLNKLTTVGISYIPTATSEADSREVVFLIIAIVTKNTTKKKISRKNKEK